MSGFFSRQMFWEECQTASHHCCYASSHSNWNVHPDSRMNIRNQCPPSSIHHCIFSLQRNHFLYLHMHILHGPFSFLTPLFFSFQVSLTLYSFKFKFKVQVLSFKSGPGVEEALWVVVCSEDLWTRETRYLYSTQYWTGLEKPQMTFLFQDEKTGRHMALIGP